eukprot:COSAG01_NODE_3958_length_5493_cov_96.792176_4_plen_318_part_00
MPGPEVTGGKRPVPVGTPAAGRDPTPGGAPCKRQRLVDRPDPAAGQQEEAVAGQRDGSSSDSDSDSSSDSDSDSSSDSSSDSDSGGKQMPKMQTAPAPKPWRSQHHSVRRSPSVVRTRRSFRTSRCRFRSWFPSISPRICSSPSSCEGVRVLVCTVQDYVGGAGSGCGVLRPRLRLRLWRCALVVTHDIANAVVLVQSKTHPATDFSAARLPDDHLARVSHRGRGSDGVESTLRDVLEQLFYPPFFAAFPCFVHVCWLLPTRNAAKQCRATPKTHLFRSGEQPAAEYVGYSDSQGGKQGGDAAPDERRLQEGGAHLA